MLQRWKDRRIADEGGFTLIELLVVIIILGILAAVVVFAVGGVGDKGQEASCTIDERTIRTAQEAYAAQAPPNGGGGNYGTEAQLVPGFMSEPSEYHDVTVGTTGTLVRQAGTDGQMGTADDVQPSFALVRVGACA